MKIAFRVDASVAIGTGHAIRCLTLANSLKKRGAETCFVGNIQLDYIVRRLQEEGHSFIALPPKSDLPDGDLAHSVWLGGSRKADAELCLTALKNFNPRWLVVDHYALEAGWERAMSKVAKRIMVIDDLGDRQHDCDLLLDQNFRCEYEGRYAGLLPERCTLLMGPKYALLQPEYAALRPAARVRQKIERVLIYLGGGDPDGQLTIFSLRAVCNVFPSAAVDVVYQNNNTEVWADLKSIATDKPNVRLHSPLPSLASMVNSADLAVGAVGASSWERLCLGLPAVTIVCADNQSKVASELESAGLVCGAGNKEAISFDILVMALNKAKSRDLPAWSRDCMRFCDGQGAGLVAEHIYPTNVS